MFKMHWMEIEIDVFFSDLRSIIKCDIVAYTNTNIINEMFYILNSNMCSIYIYIYHFL